MKKTSLILASLLLTSSAAFAATPVERTTAGTDNHVLRQQVRQDMQQNRQDIRNDKQNIREDKHAMHRAGKHHRHHMKKDAKEAAKEAPKK